MSETRTDIGEIGEFGIIDRLTNGISLKNETSIFGVGDDAAVIDGGPDEFLLVSTDTLVEGVHFNLMYMPLKHLGYKAVAVNVSDICAMNGKAEQITVSIAVSNRFSLEALEELYAGIKLACLEYDVDLVGGDTTSSVSGLMIGVTAIGRVKKEEIVYRSGAKEFDLLVVSGDLGGAYMGLQLLEREKDVFKSNPMIQPDLDGHDYIMQRQLKPEARHDIIKYLKELGVKPTAMIDVSDGLASEILHLCKSSNVGCHVYDEKLPIDAKTSMTALDFNLDPSTCALNGGEDYELLFTIKQSDFEIIQSNPNFSIIGHITNVEDGVYFVDKSGSAVTLKAQGWKHF
ncbi:MAG: thiamine-phosphate kinase [Crocinitomicaceae bacterium]|jgi:thiamine-monophosphate kinase|nr:thiamine-phosphate kinase [Crocinitomicaceae bacterium]